MWALFGPEVLQAGAVKELNALAASLRYYFQNVPVPDISTALSLAGNSGFLTWLRHSSRKSSATHSSRSVCAVCSSVCPNDGVAASVSGFITYALMLMYTTACARGLYELHKRVFQWKLTLGGKTLSESVYCAWR